MYGLKWMLKTFNNYLMDAIIHDLEVWLMLSTSWPTKIISNLFVQMSNTMFTANQNLPHKFLIGKAIKCSVHYNEVKPHKSVNTFSVTTVHLDGPNVVSLEPFSNFNSFSGFSSTYTYNTCRCHAWEKDKEWVAKLMIHSLSVWRIQWY